MTSKKNQHIVPSYNKLVVKGEGNSYGNYPYPPKG
jgi:hypothetical protein